MEPQIVHRDAFKVMGVVGFDYFPPGTGEGDSPIEIWFPVKEPR